MPIVFVDQRISINSNTTDGTTILSATPLLIGDIGLQTASVANTANAANVRVALNGSVNITGNIELVATVTLTVERNGTGTAGTGALIYTEIFNTAGDATFSPISITTGDFPPAAAVNTNELRYTLFIASSGPTVLAGPVGFNGFAAAGTST